MARLRLAGAILAAAIFIALPAASATAAEGTLEVAGPLLLGAGTFAATEADLLWNATALPTLLLEAESLLVERYGSNETIQATPVGGGVRVAGGFIDERAQHGPSRLALRLGEGDQVVLVRGDGAIQVTAPAGELRPAAHVALVRADTIDRWGPCSGDWCAEAVDAYELSTPSSTGTLAGTITLFVRGPSVVVTHAEGETAYRSGHATTRTATLTTNEDAWVRVVAQGATATLDAPGPARWYSAQPRLETASASAARATGSLSVGAFTYPAHGDALHATGQLVLDPQRLAPRGPATPAPPGTAVYADAFTTGVAGDVATVNLRAVPVFADTPAETAGLLAVAGAAAAALVYYWPHVAFHVTSAAIPFYTRLKRPEILANDVRNSIFAIIRGSPGISARAVQRESALSWGTVVYHLRQLERHHLVVSRTLGRTRNYYENHGKYKGMEIQLACLQSDRALTLARLVLGRPGVTQEDLASASGFPQPTTSYYVRKLKQAGLVEEQRVGRYAHYLPGAELARFVAMSEDVPAPTPAGPSA